MGAKRELHRKSTLLIFLALAPIRRGFHGNAEWPRINATALTPALSCAREREQNRFSVTIQRMLFATDSVGNLLPTRSRHPA